MAEQTPAPAAKPTTNGAKPPGHTEVARAKISAAQKAAHKKNPHRNTTPLSPEKQKRLRDLVKAGSTLKDAAAKEKVGYSTAQRYLRGLPKLPPKTVKGKKGVKGRRLSGQQIALIQKRIPQMGPDLRAEDIAKEADCHIASVYHYRKQMQGPTAAASAGIAGEGIPLPLYSALKAFNKRAWEDCWKERVELSTADLRLILEWRDMNGED